MDKECKTLSILLNRYWFDMLIKQFHYYEYIGGWLMKEVERRREGAMP